MLSYQHAWHAGNFADVHKHLVLYALIERLMQKKSAISFIDTHAGRGLYPLAEATTARLGEYRDGVLPLWEAYAKKGVGEATLTRFGKCLAKAQPGRALDCYPGSPWWLSQALRPQDRLTLFERHPGEYRHLEGADLGRVAPTGGDSESASAGRERIHRQYGDGLGGLLQRLPVNTPRLCVLIDPAWEMKGEYREVADTLAAMVKKVRHAVVLIWYPLLPDGRHQTLLEGIRGHGLRNVWRSELVRYAPQHVRGLYGSGLLLLNPPWQLGAELDSALAALAALYGGEAAHKSDQWLPE